MKKRFRTQTTWYAVASAFVLLGVGCLFVAVIALQGDSPSPASGLPLDEDATSTPFSDVAGARTPGANEPAARATPSQTPTANATESETTAAGTPTITATPSPTATSAGPAPSTPTATATTAPPTSTPTATATPTATRTASPTPSPTVTPTPSATPTPSDAWVSISGPSRVAVGETGRFVAGGAPLADVYIWYHEQGESKYTASVNVTFPEEDCYVITLQAIYFVGDGWMERRADMIVAAGDAVCYQI